MESLNYAFEGRETLFTGDANFPIENLIRSRNPIADSVGSMGFIEPNVPNDIRKRPVLADQFLKNSAEASEHRSGNMVSAKRVRITDSKSQSPSCQVHGCNKDLSDSKDYHKRHKVCDVHSKTAVVVVNGIQQRFCQQCSRFHVLAEFDEGKRSCRKRLAGHNERRRKPQFNAHVFGSTFGSGLSKTSLFFSGFLPSRFFNSGPVKDNMIVKSEHDELAVPLRFSHSSSVQERLSASSISSCALSLLSAQSQNISNGSINRPLIFRQGQSLRKSRKHELENSTVVDSFNGINHEGLPFICNEGVKPLNSKHSVSQESGNTVDLVGLSLHLQRIEQQKHYDARVQMQDI